VVTSKVRIILDLVSYPRRPRQVAIPVRFRAIGMLGVGLAIVSLGSGEVAQARVAPLRWSRPIAVDKRGGGLLAISCPSMRLCVAVDGISRVLTTTRPTGRATAWRTTGARLLGGSFVNFQHEVQPAGGPAIDCLSARLCVVTEDDHELFISTSPTGGQAAWRRVAVDTTSGVTSVSCPSRTLCVAVDESGNVLSATSPTGGAAAWSSVRVDPAANNGEGGVYAISCPSPLFCAAVDDEGNVLSTSNPTGGVAAWRVTAVDSGLGSVGGLRDVSCPSVHLCVAVDGISGDVVTSTHPGDPHKPWRGVAISPAINENIEGRLTFVHCDFVNLCVAADNLGHVYTSRHPTRGASAWSTAEFGLIGVACPSASLCLALDEAGAVRLGRRP
jgi:hypothetical protein